MLHLTFVDASTSEPRETNAEMFVSSESGGVQFCITTKDKKQFDFSLDTNEWILFKNFIETKQEQDRNNSINY